MDEEKGVEKIWLVWLPQPVPALEAVKDATNPSDKGEVKGDERRRTVRDALQELARERADVRRDDEQRLTVVTAPGDVVAALLRLEHH